MRVVIVSDTHIPKRAKRLPSELIRGLERADAILHAGDWVDEAVIEELEAYAPVYGVAGNCDPPELRRRLGERRIVRLGGYRIGLVHGEGRKGTTLERAIAAFAGEPLHLLVFGHTHLPYKGRHGEHPGLQPGFPHRPAAQSPLLLRRGPAGEKGDPACATSGFPVGSEEVEYLH